MDLLTPEKAQELSEKKWADIVAGKDVKPGSSCGWCLFMDQYPVTCDQCPTSTALADCDNMPALTLVFDLHARNQMGADYIKAAQEVLDQLVENREALIAAGHALAEEYG